MAYRPLAVGKSVPVATHRSRGRYFDGGRVALPLFAGIVLVERKPLPWLADLQHIVRHHVVPLFRQSSVGGLLLISWPPDWVRSCCFAAIVRPH